LRNIPATIAAIPFYFGKSSILNVYLTYHPDSHSCFNNHSEFYTLFDKFIDHNKVNNAGDTVRLWSFILNIKQVISENIEGDFAELGVWRGNTATILAYFASSSNRRLVLFDTFDGFDNKDLRGVDADRQMAFNDTSIDLVKKVLGEQIGVCDFIRGYFPDSIREEHKRKRYAVVSLDCDLYEPMKAGLEFFYPLMSRGGIFLLHDYSSLFWGGAKKAIDEFCERNGEYVIAMPDKSGSAFFRKST